MAEFKCQTAVVPIVYQVLYIKLAGDNLTYFCKIARIVLLVKIFDPFDFLHMAEPGQLALGEPPGIALQQGHSFIIAQLPSRYAAISLYPSPCRATMLR